MLALPTEVADIAVALLLRVAASAVRQTSASVATVGIDFTVIFVLTLVTEVGALTAAGATGRSTMF